MRKPLFTSGTGLSTVHYALSALDPTRRGTGDWMLAVRSLLALFLIKTSVFVGVSLRAKAFRVVQYVCSGCRSSVSRERRSRKEKELRQELEEVRRA